MAIETTERPFAQCETTFSAPHPLNRSISYMQQVVTITLPVVLCQDKEVLSHYNLFSVLLLIKVLQYWWILP